MPKNTTTKSLMDHRSMECTILVTCRGPRVNLGRKISDRPRLLYFWLEVWRDSNILRTRTQTLRNKKLFSLVRLSSRFFSRVLENCVQREFLTGTFGRTCIHRLHRNNVFPDERLEQTETYAIVTNKSLERDPGARFGSVRLSSRSRTESALVRQ